MTIVYTIRTLFVCDVVFGLLYMNDSLQLASEINILKALFGGEFNMKDLGSVKKILDTQIHKGRGI